jgi:hypothetical protein
MNVIRHEMDFLDPALLCNASLPRPRRDAVSVPRTQFPVNHLSAALGNKHNATSARTRRELSQTAASLRGDYTLITAPINGGGIGSEPAPLSYQPCYGTCVQRSDVSFGRVRT